MILYILGIAAVILLALLYRYLPNKKIFTCFCICLAAAGAIVYHFWSVPPTEPAVMTEEERYELQQQQQIFADWYVGYQRDIDELDRNWQWYHHIIEDFKEDNISIQTAMFGCRNSIRTARRSVSASNIMPRRLHSMMAATTCSSKS